MFNIRQCLRQWSWKTAKNT